ncbi:uncharacterized protein [Haliotis cracherodii]|uniref:uncharacterized protein n=1 Tax=Haliotis cracherodii TaxID=6455 RepID=UPI0039EA84F3
MKAAVSVVNAVLTIWLLQGISRLTDAQNTTAVECPVEIPDGYSIVGSKRYPETLYVTCQGCNGQDSWGNSKCKEDGTREEVVLPNCTVSCLNSEMFYRCKSWVIQECAFNVARFWELCGRSCDTPALCHRESGESDCQCGKYAQDGRCETEADIRNNVCPYTCSLRANITCGDPNVLFSHAVATLQTTPHWLDITTFRCEPGDINMGHASWVACSINGSWIIHSNVQTPHCVPKRKYGTFRLFHKSIRLMIFKSHPAETDLECAAACRDTSTCSYFIFEKNACDLCRFYKWRSGGISMTGRQLWQKVLPTQYSLDFARP